MSRCQSFRGINPRRTLGWLLLALVLVLAVRKWICMLVLVCGNSMVPTLRDGQMVMVNKMAYILHPPERGDLVFIWTGREIMIKRIIGLPNEEVALHNGRLYVNGRSSVESYLEHPGHLQVAPGKIPPNCFGVAGDNRLRTIIAVVHRERIVGKLMWRQTPRSGT